MTREARNEIQIWSAIGMLTFGSGLSIAGFCVAPIGELSDSVLLVLAQCFIYAGSALGIDYYVKAKINQLNQNQNNAYQQDKEKTSGLAQKG